MTALLEAPAGRHRAPEQVGIGGVTVGTIFYRSWGYDQTNVNYYVVTKLSPSGKTATLREVGLSHIDNPQAPQTHVVPDVEHFIDEGRGWCAKCKQRTRERSGGVLTHINTGRIQCIDADGYEIKDQFATAPPPTLYTKRIKIGYRGDEPVLSWNSYSNAYLWDGNAQYQTGYGWGH